MKPTSNSHKPWVLISGATSGFGEATALTLSRSGWNVLLSGRRQTRLEQVAESCKAHGAEAHIFAWDVRDREATDHGVAQLMDAAGLGTDSSEAKLHALVNNAGLEYPGSIIDGQMDRWREMVNTNILALLAGCQAGVKAMRTCGSQGHIVNVSSVSAQRPNSGVYGATKHAVNVISSSLRDELENDDIRITNVLPGATSTNFARNFPPAFAEQFISAAGLDIPFTPGQPLPAETLDTLANNLKPMLCNPIDVANAVIYAVSQPINVNIAEIVVRPPRAMNVAH